MRLLMLSWRQPGHPQAGGAETLTFEILKRVSAQGHSVTWFAAQSAGASQDEIRDGIRFIRRGRQWTVHLCAWRWLRHRISDFDVVVDQVNTIPFLTPLYVPAAKRRLLIHQLAREYWWRQTRGLFKLIAPLGYALEPQYLKCYRSGRTITISASTRDDLVALGFGRDRIRIIPLAITDEPIAQLQPKTGPFRMIVIGRLTPAKFVEEAIDVFAQVYREDPASRLDMVGAGDPLYRARLENQVARLGLSEAVTFHGRVSDEDRSEMLERAHVHVFTSHREGWGLTVTEAAGRGTPSIGYDAPGVRDSIRDARLLAPLGAGPAGLAERVLELRRRPDVYADVRDAAWRFARSLSYDATTDVFLAAIRD